MWSGRRRFGGPDHQLKIRLGLIQARHADGAIEEIPHLIACYRKPGSHRYPYRLIEAFGRIRLFDPEERSEHPCIFLTDSGHQQTSNTGAPSASSQLFPADRT